MVIREILVLGPAFRLKRFSGFARVTIRGLGLYTPGSIISPGFKHKSFLRDPGSPRGPSLEKVLVL